jgi:3-dehydroquinate synthase
MQTVKVKLTQQDYDIHIASGLLGQVGKSLVELGFKSKGIIITNPVVKNLYLKKCKESLEEEGFSADFIEVPDGEEYKSLEWAGKLYNELASLKAERMTPILALGGGVIGDLAGFVAATYMRGVPLFQIPTTLLAQVDSSIGGKTAVNHGQLKNNVGTFYQPKRVLADVSVLKTLPVSQVGNGIAEIIKYGVIRDKELFQLIESNLTALTSLDEEFTEEVISRCTAIKAEIVEKDEKDLGLRNILNYGHTTGHAIETVSEFGVSHGQGVAIGMVAAAMISQRMGVLAAAELNKIKSILVKAGLPINIGGLDIAKILQAMKYDKKNAGGKVKFVLLKTIGEVFISDNVNVSMVEQVLKELYEETQDLRHNRR